MRSLLCGAAEALKGKLGVTEFKGNVLFCDFFSFMRACRRQVGQEGGNAAPDVIVSIPIKLKCRCPLSLSSMFVGGVKTCR